MTLPWCCSCRGSLVKRSLSSFQVAHWRWPAAQRGRLSSPSSDWAVHPLGQTPWMCPVAEGGPVPQFSPREKDETERIIRSFVGERLLSKIFWNGLQMLTSNPCSRPTFIISLHRFGTMHMTSTAFCNHMTKKVVGFAGLCLCLSKWEALVLPPTLQTPAQPFWSASRNPKMETKSKIYSQFKFQ